MERLSDLPKNQTLLSCGWTRGKQSLIATQALNHSAVKSRTVPSIWSFSVLLWGGTKQHLPSPKVQIICCCKNTWKDSELRKISAHALYSSQKLVKWRVRDITLIGVYHFRWEGGFLTWGFFGLGSQGSYSCSGNLIIAFLGFSSFAPSSVDPLSPHRTWCQDSTL